MYSVLVVDDELSECKGLSVLVNWRACGFEIGGFCKDGYSALEELERFRYDLMITDIRMPKMSGMELVERIDALKIPIKTIILSAYADFAYAQHAIVHGVMDYLLKPVEEQRLIAALNRVRERLNRECLGGETDSQAALPTDLVAAALQLIEELDGRSLTVNALADRLFVSPNHLGQVFKARVGSGLNEYIRQARVDKAKALLANQDLLIYEVGMQVGFTDVDYFTRVFKQSTGMTPSAYRQRLQSASEC